MLAKQLRWLPICAGARRIATLASERKLAGQTPENATGLRTVRALSFSPSLPSILLQAAGVCSAPSDRLLLEIAMQKFFAFVAAAMCLCASHVANAAAVGQWYTCKDGLKVQIQVSCDLHGGVRIEATKATSARSKPIDASKDLVPRQTATAKSKTKSSAATAAARKKVSARSSSPTAKCNDGALYYLRERRGACATHGGVDKWFGW